jgi:hypothetical protein
MLGRLSGNKSKEFTNVQQLVKQKVHELVLFPLGRLQLLARKTFGGRKGTV